MAKSFFLAAVAAGLLAVSFAYEPQCRPEGERCTGASGYPAVEWIPCCDGYECSADDTSYGGYGKVCAPKSTYAPKCRPEGERCMGASGYPAVEWIPCCDGYECSADDTSYDGYGKLCAPKNIYAPKCRPEGERCMGASGYPAVEWISCCDGYECSADDTSYGGYGKICAAPVYTTAPPVYTTAPPVYTTEPPVYTTEPPVYTTAAPKCMKEGKECDAYDMKCCDDLECVESGKYDYTMSCEQIKYTTAPPTTTTTAPKCVDAGGKCDEYMMCCDYAQCVKDDYGDSSTCKTY